MIDRLYPCEACGQPTRHTDSTYCAVCPACDRLRRGAGLFFAMLNQQATREALAEIFDYPPPAPARIPWIQVDVNLIGGAF